MAYSKDFREKTMELCARGYSDHIVGEKLGVSPLTIKKWKKRLFDTGSLEKKKPDPKPGKPYKYTPDRVMEMLDKSRETKPKNISIGNGHESNSMEISKGHEPKKSFEMMNPMEIKSKNKNKKKKKGKKL